MADFSKAINFILAHEGGFAETPAGEYVNRGINTDTLVALGYKGTKDELKEIVKNLTLEQTKDIYQKFYWTFKKPSLPNALDLVTSQAVAGKILDMTVLSGQRTAIKLVQRAAGIISDGYFGSGTLNAVNTSIDFVQDLIKIWSVSLASIADNNMAKAKANNDPALLKYWERVKIGWLKRASWNGA